MNCPTTLSPTATITANNRILQADLSCLRVGLVSNPNCGKTTLLNALTGSKQKVGNWPGVTVERKSGWITLKNQKIEIIDLPGIYSISLAVDTASLDEKITYHFIMQEKVDCFINIIAAHQLERHLYLTMQLLELDVPFIIALNMMDMAKKRQIKIDVPALSQQLHRPIITLTASQQEGINHLTQQLIEYITVTPVDLKQTSQATRTIKSHLDRRQRGDIYNDTIESALTQIQASFSTWHSHSLPHLVTLPDRWLAIRALEGETSLQDHLPPNSLAEVVKQQTSLKQRYHEDADILLADGRYRFIEQVIGACVTRIDNTKKTWTTRIDNILLGRFLGIPCFFCMMYLLFVLSINVGGIFQDFFDIGSDVIFVKGLFQVLTTLQAPTWMIVLLSQGLGKGINTVLTFVPVLFSLFFFLAFLEDSGYMVRAAFLIDRVMYRLGLPGKAFVPMIVGFGCNVPSIMGARVLENKRDRTLTIMMSPFMSCGARLAIYTVFTATFFNKNSSSIVFLLYLIGLCFALLTGYLLRHTLLQGEPEPLIMELPSYQFPNYRKLALQAWQRLKGFLFGAGKLIIPISLCISLLNAIHLDGSLHVDSDSQLSVLAMIGKAITPLFSPIGISSHNWPATVGLVTGVLAKEVVVGTLNTLYTHIGIQAGQLMNTQLISHTYSLFAGLKEAGYSIIEHLSHLTTAFSNPLLASAKLYPVSGNMQEMMFQRFGSQVNAFSYLLFVLLYFPCVSVSSAIAKELDWKWALFSIVWTTSIAYGVALIFYQTATFPQHPLSSLVWISIACTIFLSMVCIMKYTQRISRDIDAGEPRSVQINT